MTKNISDLPLRLSAEEQSESETTAGRAQPGREGDHHQWAGGPSQGELGAWTSTCPGSPES